MAKTATKTAVKEEAPFVQTPEGTVDTVTGEVVESGGKGLANVDPGSKELASGRGESFATAIQKAAMLEGGNDILIGRLSLYQGTPTEQANYDGCGFTPGDFVDALGKCKVAENKKVKIVPVHAFTTYMLWPNGAPTPTYLVRDRRQVPPDHLEWKDGKPPICAECINALVLVEGQAWPFLLIFKRTSFKAGQNIFTLEGRRRITAKDGEKMKHGCYELSSSDASQGTNRYKKMQYRPAGDCPDSLKPLLEVCIQDLLKTSSVFEAETEKVYANDATIGAEDAAERVI